MHRAQLAHGQLVHVLPKQCADSALLCIASANRPSEYLDCFYPVLQAQGLLVRPGLT